MDVFSACLRWTSFCGSSIPPFNMLYHIVYTMWYTTICYTIYGPGFRAPPPPPRCVVRASPAPPCGCGCGCWMMPHPPAPPVDVVVVVCACNALQCAAVQRNAIQCNAMQSIYAMQGMAMQLQFNAIQHCIFWSAPEAGGGGYQESWSLDRI